MFLGIDLGTSAVKLCVTDAAGTILATSTSALTADHPFDGASEQSCAAWWEAVCAAAAALDPDLRAQLTAIGLSGQMHGAVVLDAAGRPLRPAILWNDTRADAECVDILAALPEAAEISGVEPMAGFTAPKLLWISRHEPALHARIAHVLLPKDYIGFRLHGEFITDPSDAAGTSWLDQRTKTWSPELCAASATQRDWLPEIRAGNMIAGPLLPEAAVALGLPPGTPVVTGGGDAAAGAVGIGAVADGDGFVSLGTSGQLFVTTKAYRPAPARRVHSYAHTVPGHWFQMAAMLNGARPIAWLAGLLDKPIDDLLRAAETAPAGPIFLPYLTGERTPHGDADIRGGFAGLGETTTPATLMRAVVEAVAFSFADAVAALREAGTPCDTLLAIGGGTRSELLMQTIADVTGCTLGRSDAAEVGPALGAARLAQAALHPGGAAKIFAKPEITTRFTPDATRAAALSKRLAAYRALYPALKSVQEAAR